MYLLEIVVDGFRAAAHGPLKCELPDRFAVLMGPIALESQVDHLGRTRYRPY
jgi:hypothetical protein